MQFVDSFQFAVIKTILTPFLQWSHRWTQINADEEHFSPSFLCGLCALLCAFVVNQTFLQ